ncbi:hypothetical protein [Variovorax sp. dw_954]|uniref:hypothetical protein n=1 Tax=Variovorax sp. dw_954 TaxID=2720078 RepID=UPI001BD44C90|nr:hypothetical protein [Variovorax sp. dw_954]
MSSRASKKTARPLGVRGHQKRSHLVASYKAGGEMFVESVDESTTMLAIDVDPRAVSIVPQAFTVRLDLEKIFATKAEALRAEPRARPERLNGEPPLERVYTPDFLVERTHPVPLVVEAKSAIEVKRIGEALARRGRVLNNLGFHYLVVPSTEIEHRGLHANLVHMRDAMKYRRDNDIQPVLDGLIKQVANRQGQFLLGELTGVVSDTAIYLGLISGVIACDLRSGNLGVNTLLWPAHGDLNHLQLLQLEA